MCMNKKTTFDFEPACEGTTLSSALLSKEIKELQPSLSHIPSFYIQSGHNDDDDDDGMEEDKECFCDQYSMLFQDFCTFSPKSQFMMGQSFDVAEQGLLSNYTPNFGNLNKLELIKSSSLNQIYDREDLYLPNSYLSKKQSDYAYQKYNNNEQMVITGEKDRNEVGDSSFVNLNRKILGEAEEVKSKSVASGYTEIKTGSEKNDQINKFEGSVKHLPQLENFNVNQTHSILNEAQPASFESGQKQTDDNELLDQDEELDCLKKLVEIKNKRIQKKKQKLMQMKEKYSSLPKRLLRSQDPKNSPKEDECQSFITACSNGNGDNLQECQQDQNLNRNSEQMTQNCDQLLSEYQELQFVDNTCEEIQNYQQNNGITHCNLISINPSVVPEEKQLQDNAAQIRLVPDSASHTKENIESAHCPIQILRFVNQSNLSEEFVKKQQTAAVGESDEITEQILPRSYYQINQFNQNNCCATNKNRIQNKRDKLAEILLNRTQQQSVSSISSSSQLSILEFQNCTSVLTPVYQLNDMQNSMSNQDSRRSVKITINNSLDEFQQLSQNQSYIELENENEQSVNSCLSKQMNYCIDTKFNQRSEDKLVHPTMKDNSENEEEREVLDISLISKKNVIKNIMTSFKRFMFSLFETQQEEVNHEKQHLFQKSSIFIFFKQNSEQKNTATLFQIRQTILQLVKRTAGDSPSSINKQYIDISESEFFKKFKRYISGKSFNHYTISLLLKHDQYGFVFKYFLENFVGNWLFNSKISDQRSHLLMINFLINSYSFPELIKQLSCHTLRNLRKQSDNNTINNNI